MAEQTRAAGNKQRMSDLTSPPPSSETASANPAKVRVGREPEAEPAASRRALANISDTGECNVCLTGEEGVPSASSSAWVQPQELSVRMRNYTERSTATELFELADQSRLRTSMRCGYVECAQCARNFLDTAQLDGRCEVKVLPCFHCICAPCLQAALSDSNASAISCPICSRSCKRMPLHKFLPHFEVHSIRDAQQIATRDFMCEECISANRAENYCEQCVMNLCGDCSKQHRRSKATFRHVLVCLNEREQVGGTMLQRHRALYCAVHRNSCYKLFCEDCDAIICYQCAIESHQMHSYKLPTDSLVERHRRHINEMLDRLGQDMSEAQELQRCIHRGLSELDNAVSTVHADVNGAFDELMAAADERFNELLSPLQDDCRQWRDHLLSERSECSKALVDIWRTIDFLDKVISRGTDIEVLKVRGQLFKEWHQVKQLQSWRELGQRPYRSGWYEGDIHAGWQSALEVESLMSIIGAAGTIEALPTNGTESAPLAQVLPAVPSQPQAATTMMWDRQETFDAAGNPEAPSSTGSGVAHRRPPRNPRRWQQLAYECSDADQELTADSSPNWYETSSR